MSSNENLQSVADSVAGAIIEAIRTATQAGIAGQSRQQLGSSASPIGSTYEQVSSLSRQQATARATASTSQSDISQSSSDGDTSQRGVKRKLVLPTMFQLKAAKRSKSGTQPKSVVYLRDIFCLPLDCQSDNGTIAIPRGTRRNFLASKEVGLLGKIEFQSSWTAEKMRQEISLVFARPFELNRDDIENNGRRINFDYLQRTGAGSRTLCVPTISASFEWNGKQVASLAKSGGIIYILANEDIPSLMQEVRLA